MEIQGNTASQRENKRDVSDEVSTRSSKRKSNDPPSSQSPEKEIFSKDFVFSQTNNHMKTQTKLSKLFDQNSQIVRKKSSISRQHADQLQPVYT
jgi:hypothetical protein